MKYTIRTLTLASLFAIAVVTTTNSSKASAEDLFSVRADNSYQIVDTNNPTSVTQSGVLSFASPNETVLGLDYRVNGGGIWAVTDANAVYSIDPTSFVASQVGTTLSQPLAGNTFGLDFNPMAASGDSNGVLFRIISNLDDNRVIDSTTGGYFGSVEKTDVEFVAGDVNFNQDPSILGIAYDNNVINSTETQQYGIDSNLNVLVTVANNAGDLQTVGDLTVNGILSEELAIDISPDTNTAFAALQVVGGDAQLYTINLGTGAASLVGTIGDGAAVRDFTIIPASVSAVPEPSSTAVLMLGLGVLFVRRKRSA